MNDDDEAIGAEAARENELMRTARDMRRKRYGGTDETGIANEPRGERAARLNHPRPLIISSHARITANRPPACSSHAPGGGGLYEAGG